MEFPLFYLRWPVALWNHVFIKNGFYPVCDRLRMTIVSFIIEILVYMFLMSILKFHGNTYFAIMYALEFCFHVFTLFYLHTFPFLSVTLRGDWNSHYACLSTFNALILNSSVHSECGTFLKWLLCYIFVFLIILI